MGVLKLMPLVLLAVICQGAPSTYSIGGKFGIHSTLDAVAGGQATVSRDGLSLKGKTTGLIGASWRPTLYGGGYTRQDKNLQLAEGSASGYLSNYLTPYTSFGGSLNKGQVPGSIQPGLKIESAGFFEPKTQFYSGDDAWDRAEMYGLSKPDEEGPVREVNEDSTV